MSAWPLLRKQVSGRRVEVTRLVINHDGPVQPGTRGIITASRSLFSFTIVTDACGCCGQRRRVDYVTREDVELVA